MSLDVHITKEPYDNEDWGQEYLYTANITHNLGEMATAAGIYKALWRPDEIGAERAKDIIDLLEEGLRDLIDRPTYFEVYNSPNGWGTYKNFLPFVVKYLEALKAYPDGYLYSCR